MTGTTVLDTEDPAYYNDDMKCHSNINLAKGDQVYVVLTEGIINDGNGEGSTSFIGMLLGQYMAYHSLMRNADFFKYSLGYA